MILSEKVHKFYYDQIFYKAAKKYRPELQKIVLEFLRKKGVKKFRSSSIHQDSDVDFSTLGKKPPKERREKARSVVQRTEVDKNFFKAEESYSGKMKIVPFTYDDKLIHIEIATNEEFLFEGHDLKILIKDPQDTSYGRGSEYYYKLNLTKKIMPVLEEIWSKLQESLKKYEAGEDEKPRISSPRHSVDSDIDRLLDTYLRQWTKKRQLKSGEIKKTKYTDLDKLPVEFYIKRSRYDNKSEYSSHKQKDSGFTLAFKVKGKRPDIQKIKEVYPNIESYYETYYNFMKQRGSWFAPRSLRRFLERYKIIDDSHKQMFNQLKFVVRKFMKLGYFPHNSMSSWKRGEPDEVRFKYSDKIKKKANENVDSVMNRYFDENVKKQFYNERIDIKDLPKKFIKDIFTTEKR